jgi:aspartate/methionine/tyrosine aminotransferase
VQSAGGRAQPVVATADRDYVTTAADLEAAWVPGTCAVVLANPANPTGAALAAEHWTAIAEWAARRDVWIVSDDVYSELVYDRAHVHVLRAAPELRERSSWSTASPRRTR